MARSKLRIDVTCDGPDFYEGDGHVQDVVMASCQANCRVEFPGTKATHGQVKRAIEARGWLVTKVGDYCENCRKLIEGDA